MSDIETWVNESRGPIGVMRKDAVKGTRVDLVRPGGRVLLTEEERQLMDEAGVKDKDNPFKNGRFSATTIVDTAKDAAAIRDNPNVISRTDIDEILELPVARMEARLKKIDSVVALQRILEVADGNGATARRAEAIRDRLTAVKKGAPSTAPAAKPASEPVFSGQREPWYPADDPASATGTAAGD